MIIRYKSNQLKKLDNISLLLFFQRMHIPKLTMDVLNGIAQFQAEEEMKAAGEDEQQELIPGTESAVVIKEESTNNPEPPAPGE